MNKARTQLNGWLGSRFAAAVAQLDSETPYSDALVVQDVAWRDGEERLFQDYRGDLSGRYLDAVTAAVDSGRPVDLNKAGRILRTVLDCQQPDGSFGPPSPALELDHGSAWGHGRLLDGLISAQTWVAEPDRRDLELATERLAGLISTRAPRWARATANEVHKFSLDPLSSILPLVRLADSATPKGADAYLAAAEHLTGSLPDDPTGLHSHGFLLAVRGALALLEHRPDAELEERLLRHVDLVERTSVLEHGGVLEHVGLADQDNTEACATADWIMLQLSLHERSGDIRHLETATRAVLNGLTHAQRPSGHFGCQTVAGDVGILVSDYAPSAWWCCTFHAIRALHEFAQALVRSSDGLLTVNVPVDLTAHIDGEAVLEVSGDYPMGDRVHVQALAPVAERVRLLVPETASVGGPLPPATHVMGDGMVCEFDAGHQNVEVPLRSHDWAQVGGRSLLPPFTNTTRPETAPPGRVTVWHGPFLLAAHSANNSADDLLRADAAVWPAARRTLDWDGEGVHLRVCGFDTFDTALRLTPLARGDAVQHDAPVRVSFRRLLHRPRRVHNA